MQFTYDSTYNRVSTIQTVETNAASYTYNYQAVPTNIPSATTGNGMLSSISASLSGNNYTVSYSYDALGRVVGRAIGGVNSSVSYDSLGRVTGTTNALGGFTNNYVGVTPLLASVVYPNGQSNSFSYLAVTNNERLAEIWNQHSGTNISKFDYTYDADGQIQTWTQQADAATPNVYQYQYDRASQLISSVLKTTGASPTVLKQFAYLYDVDGNRTSEQIGTSSPLQTALNSSSFNNLNQKTNQSPGGILQVQGALNGAANVTVNGNAATVNNDLTFSAYSSNTVASATGTSNNVAVVATYASSGKETNNYGVIVTGTTNQTLTYDNAGELLNDGVRTFTWENGVMTAITNGTHVTKFLYDGLGRRIQTQEWSGGTMTNQTYSIWCGAELCEERSSTFTVNKRFFGQGEQISGTNYYFTRDHLGSVREVLNSSGVMQARYDYDPYGRQTQVSGTLVVDFGYAGMYLHQPSGLNLTLFRVYDPNAGRWLSRDPLAENAGLNYYAYIFNNPLNAIDPLGLWSWSGVLYGAAIAVTAAAVVTAVIASGGSILLVGAAVGSGFNIEAQLISNHGDSTSIDYKDAAIAAATGAAGAGLPAGLAWQIGGGAALSALGKAAEYNGNCPDWGKSVLKSGLYGAGLSGIASGLGSAATSGIKSLYGPNSWSELTLAQQMQIGGSLEGAIPTVNGVAQGFGTGISLVVGSLPTP